MTVKRSRPIAASHHGKNKVYSVFVAQKNGTVRVPFYVVDLALLPRERNFRIVGSILSAGIKFPTRQRVRYSAVKYA